MEEEGTSETTNYKRAGEYNVEGNVDRVIASSNIIDNAQLTPSDSAHIDGELHEDKGFWARVGEGWGNFGFGIKAAIGGTLTVILVAIAAIFIIPKLGGD